MRIFGKIDYVRNVYEWNMLLNDLCWFEVKVIFKQLDILVFWKCLAMVALQVHWVVVWRLAMCGVLLLKVR